ncbi:MAG: TolC family protein [Sedimentisphaerales bacterium]|nr:TolC family protein [Sedimentisphaerales bacterium]
MFLRFQPATVVYWILCVGVVFGFLGGCRSPEKYKAEADKEVYRIIDSKWKNDFGQKTNYVVSDANIPESEVSESATTNNVDVAKMVPESGVLTLQQAVEISTKFNRDYQSQKEALFLSALGLTLTRHQYARQWFGTIDGSYVDDKTGGDDMSVDGSFGVDQQFLLLEGILVNVGIALDWTRFLTGDPRTTLGSILSGDVAIPLLGSGAGKQAREDLTQAERNVLYRIRTFNRYRKTFVVSIISDYYQVLQLKNSVIIAEKSYERLIDSTNQLKMEAEVGQRAPSEADEAVQRLLEAENNLVTTRQRYEAALDRFKIRLSLPTDANIVLDQNELAALEKIGISKPEYTEEEAMEMALARRLDLANTKDELEDSARKLELAAEGLGVQLNLTGSMDVSSADKTNFDNLQFHQGVYRLGFDTNFPFDRKAERNAYRTALINVEQRKRSYDNETDNVKLDVRQAYRDLLEKAESYRIQKEGLRLAERRVEEQKLLLEYGRGTIRLLLETEDDLVRAQNELTGALIDHTIAKMSFFRDIGILQVKPDGMWEHKTQ